MPLAHDSKKINEFKGAYGYCCTKMERNHKRALEAHSCQGA